MAGGNFIAILLVIVIFSLTIYLTEKYNLKGVLDNIDAMELDGKVCKY